MRRGRVGGRRSGPENLLIFATEPLCGTALPTSGRMEVIAKSPLTGIYGDSNAGGCFGPEVKFAGWDVIVFTGRAAHPVYLHIAGGHSELRDAGLSWPKMPSAQGSARQPDWPLWVLHQKDGLAIGSLYGVASRSC